MARLSFKKEKQETGLAGVGRPWPNTVIKKDGAMVGSIDAPTWQTSDNKWVVRLAVEDASKNCGWKWVSFKARFDSEPTAREWVKTNWTKILERFVLHAFDND